MKTQSLYKFASLFLALLLLVTASGSAVAAGEEGGAFDVQFSGVIDTADPWQIAGHAVTVNDGTRIVLTTGTVAPGMWATVQARREADGSLLAGRIVVQPAEMRLKGPVQAKPEDNLGTWTIAGQAFLVDEETRVNLRPGPIEVDTWVEVIAVEDSGGLRALRIHAVEACEDVEIYGAIQAFGTAWLISSAPVAADDASLVVGEPEVGLLVHAFATLQADDTLLGQTFKVTWAEPTRLRPPVQLNGTVEELPADGLVGVWIVNGQTVRVTEATRIFQIKGLVEVGAEVHVVGRQQDDQIVATVITVVKSPVGGGQRFQFRGVIEEMPANGLIGTWTISGQQVQVTRQTRIVGAEHAQVGAPVEAGGLQLRNGVRLCTWLRIQDRTGGGPGPQPTVTPPGPHQAQP